MKTLFLSLCGTFLCCSLFAQVDSTHNNMDSSVAPTQMNNNNSWKNNPADTSNMNMNNTNTNNRDTNTILNSGSNNQNNGAELNSVNSNSNYNSSTNMNNNTSMNPSDSLNINNSGLVNPTNIPGEIGYASLPVLETYVPDNIIADIKQRYPNTVIYDIRAVKAPEDTTMNQTMNYTDSGMNHNSDSTMGMNSNKTAMNSGNSNSSSTNMNSDSSMNSNNMNATTTMETDSTMAKPEEYNYIVRFDQNGQLTSETLTNDGTALVAANKLWSNETK